MKIYYTIITIAFISLFTGLALQNNEVNDLKKQISIIPTTTPEFTKYKEPIFTLKTTARVEDSDCYKYCNEMLKDEVKSCKVYCKDWTELTKDLKLSDVVSLLISDMKYQPEVKTENYIPAKIIK